VILLDTHAAIWLANDDSALGGQSRQMILAARAESRLALSAISFWEMALLVSKGRIELRDAPGMLREQLLGSGVTEIPLTGDIGLLAVELEDLHGGPADRFIAATAIAYDATLMTADNRLLRWQSQLRRQNASR
jgi:PIN domain nuclease of toxin-antitoxin system